MKEVLFTDIDKAIRQSYHESHKSTEAQQAPSGANGGTDVLKHIKDDIQVKLENSSDDFKHHTLAEMEEALFTDIDEAIHQSYNESQKSTVTQLASSGVHDKTGVLKHTKDTNETVGFATEKQGTSLQVVNCKHDHDTFGLTTYNERYVCRIDIFLLC